MNAGMSSTYSRPRYTVSPVSKNPVHGSYIAMDALWCPGILLTSSTRPPRSKGTHSSDPSKPKKVVTEPGSTPTTVVAGRPANWPSAATWSE
jgi:hypothetical protein